MTTHTQLRNLGLFDARVPRYTSYPTAPHFSTNLGATQTGTWMSELDPSTPVSLYVHVPFCRRLCWFCACRTQGTSTLSPVAAYLETLKLELELIKKHLPNGIKIGHLHWGGGTPTLLDPAMMKDLTRAITAVAPFSTDYEFSVEIDPNEIDDARLDALALAGMTRASIGVQDFDPKIQETIGRIQSYEITKAAVDGLRNRGIKSLNADILYGLPGQTSERIGDSVQKLLSLAPDRVALFGYAHVPWVARRQSMIPTDALPTPEERLELFNVARDLFVWDGYSEIGIDHFASKGDGLELAARSGKLRRNFQGYTDDKCQTMIGVGASSIAKYEHGYAQNAPSTSDYQKRVRAGELPITKGHQFTDEDRLRGRIIEALMCDFSVSFSDLNTRFGVQKTQFDAFATNVATAFPKMLKTSQDAIEIKEHARPLTRMIARHFDVYAMTQEQHSSAV
ncbi:oxygen-independent coproporphyrinogen III oxidase [Pacificibacter marinus]|uniref:Coproporphyrinogen-III oxidase n=1 Tax=Pacificibacter marinus TaxID=658057 RepID=A0A1Y5S864_9RHOB|nr:oxygen-independent coproporphyrinogen III oxidase [Pacificibacter marinus]SEK78490.1 oxygen-independent coproporphyrinogen-3 oxidase [Pacificibacter marinus]SLN33684.1 Oxygen-independent coproporphyrinogen-III oxidase [Pacificibacter marinus]